MQFLDAVVRVMRTAGIIRGDTDVPTSFSDLQHGATMNIAIIAIQDSLVDVMADYTLPYERTSGTITTVSGTRTYALPSDFVGFWGDYPGLYDSVQNLEIFEYPGGENQLKLDVWDYAQAGKQIGYPEYWYFVDGTTRQIGLFPTPTTGNIPVFTFDYQKDVSVTLSTDTMPFIREIEAQAFCGMATIRFKKLFAGESIAGIDQDPTYSAERARLLRLLRGQNAKPAYGKQYS